MVQDICYSFRAKTSSLFNKIVYVLTRYNCREIAHILTYLLLYLMHQVVSNNSAGSSFCIKKSYHYFFICIYVPNKLSNNISPRIFCPGTMKCMLDSHRCIGVNGVPGRFFITSYKIHNRNADAAAQSPENKISPNDFFFNHLAETFHKKPMNNDVIRPKAQEPDISPRFFSSVISRIVITNATTNPIQPFLNSSLIFSFIIFIIKIKTV